jgi:hypothetical protein
MSKKVDLTRIENTEQVEVDKILESDNEMDESKDEIVESDRIKERPIEDEKYKSALRSKIEQYKTLYFELLINVPIGDVTTKNTEELEVLLTKIKDTVQNRNIMSSIQQTRKVLPYIIEYVTKKYTPLKTEGYAAMINANKEYEYQINEIILEYELVDTIKINPLYRLGYTLAYSLMLVHHMNSIKDDKISENLNKKVDDRMNKEYGDI